jgi:hypothetical protein
MIFSNRHSRGIGVSQRGNAMILAMVTTAAMSIGFYFLSDRVFVQKKQVEKNISTMNIRLTLHSVADFILYGVRQRWCFDGSLLSDSKCDLTHDANVERLLMSSEQEQFIKDLQSQGLFTGSLPSSGTIRLTEFVRRVSISSLTSGHPLFKIATPLLNLREPSVNSIYVRVKRESSTALPQTGREVYLSIYAALTDGSDNPQTVGSFKMEINTLVTVYPRENGSFALIVPGSLHMEKAFNAGVAQGDVTFHQFANRKEVGSSPGLVFESPVFINRDIHLPFPQDRTKDDGVYTPVTFADRVVMGDGRIFENGVPYIPTDSGGPDNQLWTQNKSFGGFLKGIENDGARDAGLDYVGKILSGSAADSSLQVKCIALTQKRSILEELVNSELAARKVSSSGSDPMITSYRLGLTNFDEFNPQNNKYYDPIVTDWKGPASVQFNGGTKKPSLKLTLHIGDPNVNVSQKVTAFMASNETLTATASDLLDPNLIKQKKTDEATLQATIDSLNTDIVNLNKQISNEDKTISDLQVQIQDLQDDLTKLNNDLKDKKDELNKEEAKNPKNLVKIAILKKEIDDLEDEIAAKNSQLAKAQNDLKSAQTDKANAQATLKNKQDLLAAKEKDMVTLKALIAKLENIKNNPPVFTITTKPVEMNNNVQPQLIDLIVQVSKPGNIVDPQGNPIGPSIFVQAFDLTYYNTVPIGFTNNKISGYINYQTAPAPQYLSTPSNFSTSYGSTVEKTTQIDETDYGTLAEQCNTQAIATSGSAFGGASWDYSFAPTARHSWNFAGDGNSQLGMDPMMAELVLDGANIPFQVRSIVGLCRIRPNATFVSGFLTCDHLLIEPRSQPLRIVGTIIASKITIDPSAYKSGIRWSTIYSPQATAELRKAGILKPNYTGTCDSNLKNPIWHPIPSITEVADRFTCNAVSLRSKADPFQWTAVDPDCGQVQGKSSNTCKRRLLRYFVVEQSREAGL